MKNAFTCFLAFLIHCRLQNNNLYSQLMVIGLHGDCTANVPRAVAEVHSTEPELAIIQHPPAVANIVLDHLNKQTSAIPKGVLVNM